MAKMALKVKVIDFHFHYQPRVSQDACLEQIKWFQLKPVTSYRVDNVKFTDGRTDKRTDVFQYEQTHNMMQVWTGKLSELQLPVRTDRQTDRRKQRQYPFGLKGQGVKMGPQIRSINSNWFFFETTF